MQREIEVNLTAKLKHISADGFEPSIKKRITGFEFDGARGKYLKICYSALKVSSQAVELERVFSAVRLICTKSRTRLNDETVDTLCFF